MKKPLTEAQKKRLTYLKKFKTMKSRTVPKTLCTAIRDSRVDMESFLSSIGFSSLYNISMDSMPSRLARFVVTSFNSKSYEFKLDKGTFVVTSKKVHEILGIPLGVLVGAKKVDFMFKVNLLMLFANTMCLADTMKGFLNLTVLKRIREDTIISEIDWCGFLHDCLQYSQLPNTYTGYYIGPIAFLILLYLDSTKFNSFPVVRVQPAIKNWNTYAMKRRQDLEIKEQVIGELELHGDCRAIHLRLNANDVSAPPFNWNSWVPRKVCLFYGLSDESRDHCFFLCPKLKVVWLKFWRWWKVPARLSLSDILKGNFNFTKDKWTTKLFHAVCLSLIWYVWKWRNKILHASSDEEVSSAQQEDIFPAIQRLSLLWTSNRASKCRFSWCHWIRAPGEEAIL
ncbi:hypothetical protein CTI12_AA353220 [Artemisia annua]|uniref:Reverse transcriptase zinc-binding domain-containing protein n=1 Tax=Artemisia annua TaxID=35608 RepID=A0A2U1MQ44_ARTAN|nr:hypothetical protein CTI12_AA353220 [Artemisia annua]